MTLSAVGTGPSHAAAQPATPAPTAATPAPEPARSGAARPPAGAGGATGAGPSDTVAISAPALLSQKLDALAQAVRRLGLWLDAPVLAPRPDAGGAAPVLAGLAGEVGTAAEGVGVLFAARGTPAGGGRAAGASTAAETTQAGAALPSPASPAAYARPGTPPPMGGGWARGGASAAPDDADRDAPPARPPARPPAAGAAGPARDQRPAAPLFADGPTRGSGEARFQPDVPRGGDAPGGPPARAAPSGAASAELPPAGSPLDPRPRSTAGQAAGPPPSTAADPRAPLPAPARGDPSRPGRTGSRGEPPEATNAEGRTPAHWPPPDPSTPGDDPARTGPSPRPREGRSKEAAADLRPPAPEPPRDDGRPHGAPSPATASIAAGASLREAAELLAAAKLRLQEAPAPDPGGPAPARDAGAMEHLARCEAQVAAAMARVAGYADRADAPDRAASGRGAPDRAASGRGAPGRGRRDPAPSAGPDARAWPLAASWAAAARAAVPFCAAAAAIWAAAALDSVPVRAACAALAGAICAARAWRALVARLPPGSDVAVRPRGRA